MEIRKSAEDYLEKILMIKEEKGTVRSIDIATELQFSKASVSIAMKKLRENEYIVMGEDGLISLTDTGYAIAKSVYEKHKVLTRFFVQIGVSEKTASEDACQMEHYLSEETFNRLVDYAEKMGL